MRSVFVTGTGTGVGKTVAAAAICVASGATLMKPVQTGSLRPLDLEFVWSVTGRRDDPELACPYRFAEPLAPAVAARRAGRPIDLDQIARCASALGSPLVVEGAGGLLVRLTETATMADLARELRLPLVIVCRTGLGTLNSTALTIEAAERRGLEIVGLVLSGVSASPDLAEQTNPAELSRLAPIVGAIPHIDALDVEACRAGDLAERAPAFMAPVLGGTFIPTFEG